MKTSLPFPAFGTNSLLIKLDEACRALAEARTIQQAKRIRDFAKAAADLMKQQEMSEEAVRNARELRMRAERKLGQFLKENVDHRGAAAKRNGSTKSTRLPREISKTQSSQWQRIASLPEEEFEKYLREEKEPTTKGAERIAKIAARKASRQRGLAEKTVVNTDQKILAGNCMDILQALYDDIGPRSVDLVFLDPPYNEGVDYGDGSDVDRLEYHEYLCNMVNVLALCSVLLKPNGSLWSLNNFQNNAGIFHATCCSMRGDLALYWRNSIVWYETFGVNCSNKFNRGSRHLLYLVKDPKRFTFHPEAVWRPSDRLAKYHDSRADERGKT